MSDSPHLRPTDDHEAAQWPVLRPPLASDVDALVRLRTDSAVREFLGGPISEDAALTKANEIVGSDAHFVVETGSDEIAGLVSVTPRAGDVEFSYEFFPNYWGRGLARSACEALLKQVVLPKSSRLIAITQQSNERSRSLLRALGFDPEEEFEEFGAAQVLYVRSG